MKWIKIIKYMIVPLRNSTALQTCISTLPKAVTSECTVNAKHRHLHLKRVSCVTHTTRFTNPHDLGSEKKRVNCSYEDGTS